MPKPRRLTWINFSRRTAVRPIDRGQRAKMLRSPCFDAWCTNECDRPKLQRSAAGPLERGSEPSFAAGRSQSTAATGPPQLAAHRLERSARADAPAAGGRYRHLSPAWRSARSLYPGGLGGAGDRAYCLSRAQVGTRPSGIARSKQSARMRTARRPNAMGCGA